MEHPNETIRGALEALERHEGVSRLHLPSGQVLVYGAHLPPGLFVLVEGVVAPTGAPPTDERRQEACLDRPLVVPDPDRLDEAFGVSLGIVEDAEALYVPRTLARTNEDVRRLLGEIAAG